MIAGYVYIYTFTDIKVFNIALLSTWQWHYSHEFIKTDTRLKIEQNQVEHTHMQGNLLRSESCDRQQKVAIQLLNCCYSVCASVDPSSPMVTPREWAYVKWLITLLYLTLPCWVQMHHGTWQHVALHWKVSHHTQQKGYIKQNGKERLTRVEASTVKNDCRRIWGCEQYFKCIILCIIVRSEGFKWYSKQDTKWSAVANLMLCN